MPKLLFRRATHDPITRKYVLTDDQGKFLERMERGGIIHVMSTDEFLNLDEIAELTICYNNCTAPDCPFDLLHDLIYPLGMLIEIGAVEMKVK